MLILDKSQNTFNGQVLKLVGITEQKQKKQKKNKKAKKKKSKRKSSKSSTKEI